MFTWLARKSKSKTTARELYGAVVTQARTPAFYGPLGVADTAEGRYELIALHLVLVLERLGQPDSVDEPLRRAVLETFITDMDDCVREMGAGDMSVARRVKKAAGGIYTRAAVYGAGLAAKDDEALRLALADFLYEGRPNAASARAVAYVRAAAVSLASQPANQLAAGRVTFPSPDVAVQGYPEMIP